MAEQQFDNSNRGVLFIQKEKKSDSHPDLSGSINIDGTEYWLSAWSNRSKSGDKYLKLSIKPKDLVAPQPVMQGSAVAIDSFDDDSLPF